MANYDKRLSRLENRTDQPHTSEDYREVAENFVAAVEEFQRMGEEFFSWAEMAADEHSKANLAWELVYTMRTGELACKLCNQNELFPYLRAFDLDDVVAVTS